MRSSSWLVGVSVVASLTFGTVAEGVAHDVASLVQASARVLTENSTARAALAEAGPWWNRASPKVVPDAPQGRRLEQTKAQVKASFSHGSVAPLVLHGGPESTPLFITSLKRARLGNRLFQWAAGLAVARALGVPFALPEQDRYTPEDTPQMSKLASLVVNKDTYEQFNSVANKCHMWDSVPVTIDRGYDRLGNWTRPGTVVGTSHETSDVRTDKGGDWADAFSTSISHTRREGSVPCQIVELDGFFQNMEFFSKYASWIQEIFWHEPTAERARAVLDKRFLLGMAPGSKAVAVHIRLTDYVKMGRNLDMSYYVKALAAVKKKRWGAKLTCIIFSDQPAVAINLVPELKGCNQHRVVEFWPGQATGGTSDPGPKAPNRIDDKLSFYMMSLLPNIVIADSSYSFWSAFLSPAKPFVVAPRIDEDPLNSYAFLRSLPTSWTAIPTTAGLPSKALVHALMFANTEGPASEWSA